MRLVLISFARALLSQLHVRMLLLTILPFVVSLLLWALVLTLGMQPLMDFLQSQVHGYSLFDWAGERLSTFGSNLRPILVILLAMWLLLPFMIMTALLFVGLMALPGIVRHVARRHYPDLETRKGGSVLGSMGTASWSFLVFVLLWVVTLPLNLIPPITFFLQPLLWGWLTYRVMAYDALSEHAGRDELRALVKAHRWPLLAIGVATGLMGAAPSLVWVGGALGLVFFPVLAAVSIWLYVVIFVFSGLWFVHYCLEALSATRLRSSLDAASSAPAPSRLKDINTPPAGPDILR